ncbi:hypothetical protein BN1723_007948 [Verticillium longisporum]|uniref:Kynurenine formamidase n=1 Tax=Verticillium longisporum TaxID=100787 RepID=A0A0G4NPR3_VERLO|nr:hypothetical protein BN1723_007948 [Verticillium longisporum]
MDAADDTPLIFAQHSYGEHSLQRVGTWKFPPQLAGDDKGYWIVFIHGGAWRDPRKLYPGFVPCIRSLLASANPSGPGLTSSGIRAFASIDYRLSPHPEFPQDPSSVPPSELREARHPDHLLDVRAALASLQERYAFGDRYVLIGHSAGATMAYQLAMGGAAIGLGAPAAPTPSVILPSAVVGVSGIYELRKFVQRHGPAYAAFVAGAFGDDESAWNDRIPACYSGSFSEQLGSTRAYLSWSPGDQLVDETEIDLMAKRLGEDKVQVKVTKDLTGNHDVVLEEGTQLAHIIKTVLANLAGP